MHCMPMKRVITLKNADCLLHGQEFTSLSPRSDWYLNSPYIFNTLSSREVMRNYGGKVSSQGYRLGAV